VTSRPESDKRSSHRVNSVEIPSQGSMPTSEGRRVGEKEGSKVGTTVGKREGAREGNTDGNRLGNRVGIWADRKGVTGVEAEIVRVEAVRTTFD
jgi:hypothetical protein